MYNNACRVCEHKMYAVCAVHCACIVSFEMERQNRSRGKKLYIDTQAGNQQTKTLQTKRERFKGGIHYMYDESPFASTQVSVSNVCMIFCSCYKYKQDMLYRHCNCIGIQTFHCDCTCYTVMNFRCVPCFHSLIEYMSSKNSIVNYVNCRLQTIHCVALSIGRVAHRSHFLYFIG